MDYLKKLFKIDTREIKIGDTTQQVKVFQCKKGCGHSSSKPDPSKTTCPGCDYRVKIKNEIDSQSTLRLKGGAPKSKGGNFREVDRGDK